MGGYYPSYLENCTFMLQKIGENDSVLVFHTSERIGGVGLDQVTNERCGKDFSYSLQSLFCHFFGFYVLAKCSPKNHRLRAMHQASVMSSNTRTLSNGGRPAACAPSTCNIQGTEETPPERSPAS